MTDSLVLGGVYAVVLLLVAAYLLLRVRLAFTARGCFLGLFWLLFGLPHFYYLARLDPRMYERITWSLILMWLFAVAGMELVWLAAGRTAAAADRHRREWRGRPMSIRPSSDRALEVACWVTIVLLAAATVYENTPGKLITFATTRGINEIAIFRGTAGGSRFYWYNVVIASVAPFLTVAACLRASTQRTVASWVPALLLLGLVAIGKAGLLNRSALPIFLVQLAIAPVIARRLKIRVGLFLVVLALVGLLVYPLNYHYLGMSPAAFVKYFADRTLFAPYYGIFSYFSTFPDLVPHAIGRNIRILNWLLYDDPTYVPAMVMFARKAGNYWGSFNGMFIGEAWADFGYWGVATESFLLGVALAFADLWIFARGKSPEGVAAIVTVMAGLVVLSATALQTALFSGGILLAPFLVLLLRSVRVPRFTLRPSMQPAAAADRS